RAGSKLSRGQCAPGIEAEPANPKHARADETKYQVMRRHYRLGKTNALTQVNRANQGGKTRSNMHDGSAREIECGKASAQRRVQKSAGAPNHVGQRKIDDGNPQGTEKNHRTELHALSKGAGNQGRRDNREHQLKQHESLLRNRSGIDRIRRAVDVAKKEITESADE